MLLAAAALVAVPAAADPIPEPFPEPGISRVTFPKFDLSEVHRQLLCLKATLALRIFEKVDYKFEAYAFCSSFIKLPPATATSVVKETKWIPTTTTV